MSKPKMIFQAVAPGQSVEELKKELTEKHGTAEMKVIDGSSMNPEELRATLEKMGMSTEDINNVLSEAKSNQKKPGMFQKIQNALLS